MDSYFERVKKQLEDENFKEEVCVYALTQVKTYLSEKVPEQIENYLGKYIREELPRLIEKEVNLCLRYDLDLSALKEQMLKALQ